MGEISQTDAAVDANGISEGRRAEINAFFESSIFNAENVSLFTARFAEKNPLEYAMFVEYTSQISLPHYTSERFYGRYEKVWRDFVPYAQTRSLELVGDSMGGLFIGNHGPQNMIAPGVKRFGSRVIGEGVSTIGKGRKINSAGGTMDVVAEAVTIWGGGPQVINESLYERIHGRGYERQ